MKTLFDFLKELNPAIQIKEEKEFIISDKETISFKSLNDKSINFAKMLKQEGVKANEKVAILLDNSSNFVISVLSLWMIEAIPVPINTKLSSSEIEEQLKFLECRFALIDESFTKKVNLGNIKFINPKIIEEYSEADPINLDFNRNNTAAIMFTSGSSGKPKAVELTFSNLIQSAKIGNQYLMQTDEDRWLASLPLYHIGGFSIIFRALMYSTKLILPSDLKIQSIIQSLDHFSPTLISLVSTQMRTLLENNIQPNKELRHLLLGGGFVDSNLMQEAINNQWPVSKVYGSTETSSFITVLSPDKFLRKPESVGKPIPPNEIFIYDGNNELSINLEGEIAVKSHAVMKNYFNDKDTTNKKLRKDLYFTGDYGYIDSEGYLYVVNRRSDLIVTGGENVNPLEVEEIILQYSKVSEVCVVGIEDEKWGQKIIAAIVPKLSDIFTLDELKDFLKDKIALFKIPKEIFFVNELPKTELGKLKRDVLKKILLHQS